MGYLLVNAKEQFNDFDIKTRTNKTIWKRYRHQYTLMSIVPPVAPVGQRYFHCLIQSGR